MSDIPIFLAPILEDLSSSRSSSNRRRRALTKLDGLLATLCLPQPGETSHETEERNRIKQVFIQLQDGVDGNVASILIPLASRLLPQFHSQVVSSAKPVDFEPTLSELVGIFQVVQGICLLHRPSKNLIGGRRSTMEMILDLLLLTRHVPSFLTSLPGSSQNGLPLSSLLASTLLDTLFAALVDSSRNTRTFEQSGGLECLMRMLKGKTVPKDVRMKSLEFLFFYLLPEGQAGAHGQLIGASAKDHPIELRGGIDLEDLPIILASPKYPRTPTSRLNNKATFTVKEGKLLVEEDVPSTPNSSRIYQVETPTTQIRTRNDRSTPRSTSNSHVRCPSTPSSLGSPTSQHAHLNQKSASIIKPTSLHPGSPSHRRTARTIDLQPPALINTGPTSSSEDSISSRQATHSGHASHGLGISTSFPSPRRAFTPDTPSSCKFTKALVRPSPRSRSDSTTSPSSTTATRDDRTNISRKILSSTVEKTRDRPTLYARSASPIKTPSDKASKHAAHVVKSSEHLRLADRSSLGISNVNRAPDLFNNSNILPSPLTSQNSTNKRFITPPVENILSCMPDMSTVASSQLNTDRRPVIQIQSPSRASSEYETPLQSRKTAKEADYRINYSSKITSGKPSVVSTPQSHKTNRALLSVKDGGPEEKEDLFSSPRAINSHVKRGPEEDKKVGERTRSSGLMLPPKDIPAHRRVVSASPGHASDSTPIQSLTGVRQSPSLARQSQVLAETSSRRVSTARSYVNIHPIPSPSTEQPQSAEEPPSVHPVFLPPPQALPPVMLPLPSPTMSNSTVSPSISSDGSLSPYITPSTSPYLLSIPHLSPDPSFTPSSSSAFPPPSRSPSKSPRIRQSRPPSAARSPRAPRSDAGWADMNGQGNMVGSRGSEIRTVQEKKALLSVYLGDLDRLMGVLSTPAKGQPRPIVVDTWSSLTWTASDHKPPNTHGSWLMSHVFISSQPQSLPPPQPQPQPSPQPKPQHQRQHGQTVAFFSASSPPGEVLGAACCATRSHLRSTKSLPPDNPSLL